MTRGTSMNRVDPTRSMKEVMWITFSKDLQLNSPRDLHKTMAPSVCTCERCNDVKFRQGSETRLHISLVSGQSEKVDCWFNHPTQVPAFRALTSVLTESHEKH
ncbi:uncharacterized protein LOC110015624 isoform X2 [Oryzias latipes]